MEERISRLSCGDSTMKIEDVAKRLRIMDANLASSTDFTVGDVRIIMLNFERYYMRTKDYAGLTVLLTESGAQKSADVTGFAGGLFDWGAEWDFAKEAVEILKKCGFTEG